MCQTCGCTVTHGNRHLVQPGGMLAHTGRGTESISLLRNLLSQNDKQAQHNRKHFDSHRVLAINLMSSPGAGKTALLERTIESLGGRLRMAVIEGDLATENDARRIRAKGVPAIQITTGNACHLDAHMVHDSLHSLDLAHLDIVFIENVGNLVCPASFDLGQHMNVTLLSVPEGDDKPEKYPVMFRTSDLLLISKCDLLTALPEFNVERAVASLRQIASDAPVMQLSARTGAGFEAWTGWIVEQLESHRALVAAGAVHRPEVAPDILYVEALE